MWTRKEVPAPTAYRRTLGMVDLTGIGIAAIIGAGIFFLLGEQAVTNGPAVMVALVVGGVGAVLAAYSYAEASSRWPGSGSAYAFSYAAFGALPAFMVGWLFVNAYAIGNGAVAAGWSTYFVSAVEGMGASIPDALTKAPLEGGFMNLPAASLVVFVTILAMLPIQTSTRVNNLLVALKLGIVLFVIVAGAFLVRPENWTPFAPSGVGSIAGSTAVLFFAYLGFDTIAAAGAEAKNPRKHLPRAILLSVGVCTLLYVLMAGVVTGMATPALQTGRAPIAEAFALAGRPWAGGVVTAGAVVALATVAYAFHVAMARILHAMAVDGFMPRVFARMSPQGVPVAAALGVGAITLVGAAFLPLDLLVNLGVLASIAIYLSVSVGTLVVGPSKGFRVPRIVHVAAILVLLAIIVFGIDVLIHLAFVGWVALGLIAYGFFAYKAAAKTPA